MINVRKAWGEWLNSNKTNNLKRSVKTEGLTELLNKNKEIQNKVFELEKIVQEKVLLTHNSIG